MHFSMGAFGFSVFFIVSKARSGAVIQASIGATDLLSVMDGIIRSLGDEGWYMLAD